MPDFVAAATDIDPGPGQRMIIGKVIGGILGYSMGGILPALLGVFVGHLFDQGYRIAQMGGTPEQRQRIQDTFFSTVFRVLGHLAKADGRISEAEIAQTEQFMAHMGLSAEHRREAIDRFKQGSAPDFDLDAQLQEFLFHCGRRPNLIQMLLVYLINMALADGHLDDSEERVLRQVAERLGISASAFERLIRMMRAQDSFRGGEETRADNLELAYQALGVDSSASDAEIKKAYRKLMNQYHPDKLIGQGVPDDMIEAATERSQEIRRAYDAIKKARGRNK